MSTFNARISDCLAGNRPNLHIRTPQFKIKLSKLESNEIKSMKNLAVPVERGEGVSLSVTSDCMLSKARSVSPE